MSRVFGVDKHNEHSFEAARWLWHTVWHVVPLWHTMDQVPLLYRKRKTYSKGWVELMVKLGDGSTRIPKVARPPKVYLALVL